MDFAARLIVSHRSTIGHSCCRFPMRMFDLDLRSRLSDPLAARSCEAATKRDTDLAHYPVLLN